MIKLVLSSILSIYKKLKKLKFFLTKIRTTVPLTEAPLVRPKCLTKGSGDLFFDRKKMFLPKS